MKNFKAGGTIKRKFKCKDGKIRSVDCFILSAFANRTRRMNPKTLSPEGEWEDCICMVVRWIDIDGTKRIDNVTIYDLKEL